MEQEERERLYQLSTPLLADACMRLGIPVRCAPSTLQALEADMHCAGRVCPVRHAGSVDIFFEALEDAQPGDVLVIDNGGRTDHACVGDLVAREVQAAGLAGIVIWGLHRDTWQIHEIGLPFFSQGHIPTGPVKLDRRPAADALAWARVGDWIVGKNDIVAADRDGVIFLPSDDLAAIIEAGEAIKAAEERQAELLKEGKSLREQLKFKEYLAQHSVTPSYTFRDHLRQIGGAIDQ